MYFDSIFPGPYGISMSPFKSIRRMMRCLKGSTRCKVKMFGNDHDSELFEETTEIQNEQVNFCSIYISLDEKT